MTGDTLGPRLRLPTSTQSASGGLVSGSHRRVISMNQTCSFDITDVAQEMTPTELVTMSEPGLYLHHSEYGIFLLVHILSNRSAPTFYISTYSPPSPWPIYSLNRRLRQCMVKSDTTTVPAMEVLPAMGSRHLLRDLHLHTLRFLMVPLPQHHQDRSVCMDHHLHRLQDHQLSVALPARLLSSEVLQP